MVTDSIKYTLDKITSTIGELPAAPAVITAAMRLTSNLESSTSQVARVLSSDQSLAAKALRIANSPYYGRVKEVNTLHEAIIILGFDALRSIIIAGSAHNLYGHGVAGDLQAKLWRHSLSTAIAARQIAEHLNHPGKEEIFIAGLLHDIGKLVLMQRLPEWYRRIVKDVEENTRSFREVEMRVFHFDHCDVASLLLAEWLFPVPLIRSIARHHRPPSFRLGGLVPIAQVINLANYMAKIIHVGFNDEKIEPLGQLESARAMGLTDDTLATISEKSQEHYQAEIRIFEEI
jgi:putative nucleotidyltransferase with HDIG domain